MKKIMAFVLVISLVVSCLIFPANAAEVESVDIEFEILKQLGIIDDNIDLEAIVTRGEFAEKLDGCWM